MFVFVITFLCKRSVPIFTLNTTKKLGYWLKVYFVETFLDILIIIKQKTTNIAKSNVVGMGIPILPTLLEIIPCHFHTVME